MNSITDNTSGHRLMFICFFHLQHSIRNVNGKLFKLNRQKLNSWINGLGTFLFEISFLFSSPPSPFPLFPTKLKSISLMKSKAFKSSLTFTIAIFPWINKIPYVSCWSHRLLLFAGESGNNNFKHCFMHKGKGKLKTVRTRLLSSHSLLETTVIMKPDVLHCLPWSTPDCRAAQRGTQQRGNRSCP